MRKVTITRGDSVIETELSEKELSRLLGVALEENSKENSNKDYDSDTPSMTRRMKNIINNSILVSTNTSQLIGRPADEQSTYQLYKHNVSQELFGIIITKKKSYLLELGNPKDLNSPISQVRGVMTNLPEYGLFTRNQIMQMLPPKIAKGSFTKFAFDYLLENGYIEKIEKTGERGVSLYRKIIGKNPHDKMVSHTSGFPTR